MRRLVALVGIAAALMPLTGCQYICTDSRGEAVGRNWIPFGRRYRMCNQSHCQDGNGNHIDQRCSCSRNCSCWGGRDVSALPDADGGCCGGVPAAK